MLELTEVQKSFGTNKVLDIPVHSFSPGIYWIKGANGSGKSTLLSILAGLLPFKGSITLNNQVSLRQQPSMYRKLLNYAPAEPIYPSFISGDELVSFTSRIKGGSPAQTRSVCEMLQIGRYTANPTGSYSSGMLKKLSLLTAFIGNPEWILLDEPFTTLDADAQKALYLLIRERRQQGVSFILTSHHDVEPSDIKFDGVFLLANGKLTPS